MSRKYKFHEKEGAYFVSFATVNWIDVFTRDLYFAIITESPQLVRATISSTASAMPQARAHKVEQTKQVNKKPSNCSVFFMPNNETYKR